MKYYINLLNQLDQLPHFEKDVVGQLGMQLGLKKSTIDTYISRYLRNRDLIQLRNGLYVSSRFFDKNRHDSSYKFYLANIIRQPSYVSSWAALQYYNLVTEATYPTTSVTTKVTRDFQTKIGDFSYQSIQQRLFADFVLKTGRFDFFIATPAKALFDLLYFRTRQFRTVPKGQAVRLAEELRIDVDEFSDEDQSRFNELIETYE